MRIVIVGVNYLPESTSIGPYTADLAEFLTAKGHDVLVITGFPMAPQWSIWEGYRGNWLKREVINGVQVLRTYMYVPKNPRRTVSRMMFDTCFSISALLSCVLFGKGPSIIVAISPPLQLGITAWIYGLFTRAPFFLQIQDLVPDAAIATGMLSETSFIVRLARRIERFIYGKASGIGVICDGFTRNLLSKNVSPRKLASLPDYIDLKFMRMLPKQNAFRRVHNLSAEDFVVMYSGSVAGKQGLETFVQAAFQLRDEPHIKFLLIGEGPYLPELRARAEDMGIPNLFFLPLQTREGLPEQLAAADLLVITQRRSVMDIVFPGKLLYYMAAGRPILASVNAESETGRFVTSHGVGTVSAPEDPKALAEAVLRLRSLDLSDFGGRSRAVAEAFFDKNVVLPSFERTLEAICE